MRYRLTWTQGWVVARSDVKRPALCPVHSFSGGLGECGHSTKVGKSAKVPQITLSCRLLCLWLPLACLVVLECAECAQKQRKWPNTFSPRSPPDALRTLPQGPEIPPRPRQAPGPGWLKTPCILNRYKIEKKGTTTSPLRPPVSRPTHGWAKGAGCQAGHALQDVSLITL